MGHVWLIGLMGSGKTVSGRILARRRRVPFYDVDDTIEDETGRSIVELFAEEGEASFRNRESAAMERIAASLPGVAAAGGGAVVRAENVEAMRRSGRVILLLVSPGEAAVRLGEARDRPLLEGRDRLATLTVLERDRGPAYEQAADLAVDTTGLSASEVAAAIEEAWNGS